MVKRKQLISFCDWYLNFKFPVKYNSQINFKFPKLKILSFLFKKLQQSEKLELFATRFATGICDLEGPGKLPQDTPILLLGVRLWLTKRCDIIIKY